MKREYPTEYSSFVPGEYDFRLIAWRELTVTEFDEFIEMLTIARRRAERALMKAAGFDPIHLGC